MNFSSLFRRTFFFFKDKWLNVKARILVWRKQFKNFFSPEKLLDKRIIFALEERKIPSVKQLLKSGAVFGKKEKFLLLIFLVIFFSSLCVEAGRFCLRHIIITPNYGGVYTEGLVGRPRYINPLFSIVSNVDSDITRLVYSGLLRFDPSAGYSADLASSYDISDDQKVYTFYLRDNLKWQDNAPLTVDDVIFTVNAIQNSEYGSPLLKSFSGVTVEKVDDKTVRFRLKEPYLGFKESLTVGILPQHLWAEISPLAAHLAEMNLKPIGAGPFKFKSFVKDKNGEIKSYTLDRNENFYGKKSYLDRIVFRFYPNSRESIAALSTGEVDGINFLSSKEALDKKQNIVYYSLTLPQYTAVFFNLKSGNPALLDKNVRKALSLAANKEKILREVLGGNGQILRGPIPRGFIGYSGEAKNYDFNLTEASAFLDKAGWKQSGDDNFRKKDGATLEITLAAVDQGEQNHLAEILRSDWEGLGVKINLHIIPSSQIQRMVIKPRLYDALIYGEILGPESELLPYWHSTQIEDPGLNLSGFSNALLDKYLEEIRKIGNLAERAKEFISLQNILVEEVPAIFLYSPNYIYPVSKRIKGIELQYIVTPKDRLASIENWFINEKRVWVKNK